MKNRWKIGIMVLVCCILLSGCGNSLNKEYTVIQDYVPQIPENEGTMGAVRVKNIDELRNLIQQFVYEGTEIGHVAFDGSYEGNVSEDLQNVIWDIRTQDALVAYCVKNISYELNKIVSYYGSMVQISYANGSADLKDIHHLPYAYGIEEYLLEALENSSTQLVILIDNSTYTADNVKSLAGEIYRQNPGCTAEMPDVTVSMFSGDKNQRLFEINFEYQLTQEELESRKEEMRLIELENLIVSDSMTQLEKVHFISQFLTQHTQLCENEKLNTVFDALVNGKADSEGIALAFTELAHMNGIEAEIVYGQHQWEDRAWNIVNIYGEHYHLDISAAMINSLEENFIKNDLQMWNDYRWDTSQYIPCEGMLSYRDLGNEVSPSDEYHPEEPETEETENSIAETQGIFSVLLENDL